MPWKNRYIGNPVLTAILNLFFGAKVSDAHCGLRALTKDCFERLALTGGGMEFASEMIIKAALKQQTMVEVPVSLSKGYSRSAAASAALARRLATFALSADAEPGLGLSPCRRS